MIKAAGASAPAAFIIPIPPYPNSRYAYSMIGRITVGVIVMIGVVMVATLLAIRYVPMHYNQASIHVIDAEKKVNVSASAWAIFSLDTGDIVFSKNEDTVLPIASVTKLATAATLLEHYDMMYTTTTTWRDVASEGRAGGLVPGEEFTREQLLFPLLLESSNDAAATLESSLPPQELIKSMNSYVSEHGLTNTHFKDPSGLSPENKSSARDLARLAYLINIEQPHVTDITRLKQFLYAQHGWQNNNPFITSAGYAWGKHGFTPEAGRTVVAVFEEQFPKNKIALVGYVLLGSSDLKKDVATLRELVRTGVYYR